MRSKGLSIEAKALYGYLSSFAGAGDTAFPSTSRILEELDISKNRFYKIRKELVSWGFISIETTATSAGLRTVYTLPQNPIAIKTEIDEIANRRNEIKSCGESPYPWESSASSRKRLRSSISVVFPCIFIIPFLFEIHRFVVIVDQAVDQNLLGFCGRYRFVGERVLCDPAAGRDRVLDLDESERFELVSISIESRLADTELPDNLTGRGLCAIIE